MESEKLIFAIGNPLLDISAECSEEVLQKYELKHGHAILAEDKHKPLFEELWKAPNVELIAGGSAMNTLRCANFMLSTVKPNSCAYFGSIAADERGDALKKSLETEGIDGDFSIADDSYTGACAVVIHNKERALIADLGACMKYKTDHFTSHAEKLAEYKIIYTTGFFITSNYEALLKVADFAVEHKKLFAFNLSAVFLIDGHKEQYEEIIPRTDFVFGNEDETSAFGKAHGVESEDRKEIASFIAKFPQVEGKSTKTRTVVVTQGLNPTIVAIHNFETGETTVNEFEVELVPKDEIVDLNSAGDSFTGGLLAALSLGHTLETAIKAAGYCAKYIIKVSGCSFPRPMEFVYPELS